MKIFPKLTSWSIWAALDLRLSKMVPKLAMWSIRGPWVQYMYIDWRPSESQTCRGLSVRLGDSLHRADSPWHVHGQRAHGPNIAIEFENSKGIQNRAKKFILGAAVFFVFRSILARRANMSLHVLQNVQTCVCSGGKGPGRRGVGGR